jgi:RNA polymerase sigma-70 factor (ECF subfamily)
LVSASSLEGKMTDPARRRPQDEVLRRVREAFADLESSVELDEVIERAARYLRRTTHATTDQQEAASPARSRDDAAVGVPAGQPAAAPAGKVVTVGGIALSPSDLAAARRRDPQALARIYQAYAPALLRFFVAAVGDRHAAEDLTGTVFVAAIEDLPGFRGEVTKLGGWLFRIARHDLHDYRRRVARAGTENLDDVLGEAALAEDPHDLSDLHATRLEGSRMMAALEQLSTDQREVLLLRLAAGLTGPEVAAALGKTTAAVRALQHRGLASLARVLGLRGDHERQHDHPGPSNRSDTPPR